MFLTLFPLQVHGGVQANCNNIREIFWKYPGNIALVAFFNNGLAAFRTETLFYNVFLLKYLYGNRNIINCKYCMNCITS